MTTFNLHTWIIVLYATFVTALWSARAYATTLPGFPGGPWNSAAREWAHWISRHVMEQHFRLSLKEHGEVPALTPGQFGICICNHPSFLGTFQWIAAVTDRISPNIVFVVKHDLNLLVRHTVEQLDMTIAIDRENGPAAKKAIRDAIPSLAARGALLVIFCDGSRPTRDKIADDRARYRGEIPDIDDWLVHTRLPRAGGLQTILEALEELGQEVPVYDLTVAFDVADEGLTDLERLRGSTLHLRYRQAMNFHFPTEAQALRDHLNQRWKLKNRLMSRWRNRPKMEKRPSRAADAS